VDGAHHEFVIAAIVALGFVQRVRAEWGTFLNPDEALHFFIANRSSLALAYKASLTMAHPPLLIVDPALRPIPQERGLDIARRRELAKLRRSGQPARDRLCVGRRIREMRG
jgi:hypothetical protein